MCPLAGVNYPDAHGCTALQHSSPAKSRRRSIAISVNLSTRQPGSTLGKTHHWHAQWHTGTQAWLCVATAAPAWPFVGEFYVTVLGHLLILQGFQLFVWHWRPSRGATECGEALLETGTCTTTMLSARLTTAAGVVIVAATCGSAASLSPTAYDVLVYGATPGGVAAAVAAGREGRTVVLVEPGVSA